MKLYKLMSGTSLELDGKDLFVTNVETGFVGKGNKHAYHILRLANQPISETDIVRTLCNEWPSSQHYRIEKSVPNVIRWGLEHGVLEDIPPE